MLVDGAKHGDVEIPVFCYEPKLGPPVGACRMCLVEIEGIPKLQTACSTPVKDGMVVDHTSDRVKAAQEAVVEFLLDQPSARLPGLRQGRRVPAAGHLVRLGRRALAHDRAQAPLQEADRAVAADRDRPRALHPLLPLRALLAGGVRGLPAGVPRARRPHLRRHERRRARTSRRSAATSSSSARSARSPRPRTASARGRGTSRTRARSARSARASATSSSPSATTRDRARDGARQRGRRGRLAVRQGPLRLPGDPLARADHAADGLGRRRAARGVVGARAGDAAAGLEKAGAATAAPRRRRDHERGGLPAAAPPARSARLAARRLPPQRRARPRPGARAGAARPQRAGVGHRERGDRARLRHRPRRGGADRRPARAQGASPPRRDGGGCLEPPDDARRERRPRGPLPSGRCRGGPAGAGGRTTRAAAGRW